MKFGHPSFGDLRSGWIDWRAVSIGFVGFVSPKDWVFGRWVLFGSCSWGWGGSCLIGGVFLGVLRPSIIWEVDAMRRWVDYRCMIPLHSAWIFLLILVV